MSSGPSKQELEMYWQNSRQYFDELAKHYQKADPEYYKEFIQPFYSNPFRSGGQPGGKQRQGGARLPVFIAMLALAGVGAATFVLFQADPDTNSDKNDKRVTADTITKKNTEPETIEPVKEEEPEPNIHFLRGEKLFREKQYIMAERFLKRVPKSDKNYEEAEGMLKEIESMRKNGELKENRSRNNPIQPVR
jgi:hypothetical protein